MSEYRGTYIVIGPPGTGKTRFLADRVERLVEAARRRSLYGRIPKGTSPVLICSLTRAAAAEIASRCPDLPAEATATIHAHAYRALGKPKLISQANVADWNKANPSRAMPNVATLVAPNDSAPAGVESLGQSVETRRLRNEPVNTWPERDQQLLADWTAYKRNLDVIDYTDMLALALERKTPPPMAPGVIIVDEAQDTSPLAFALLQHWATMADALIIVGDPWQSLYIWAGADPSILTDPSIDASHRGTLSQSYRVPQAVLDHATAWMHRHAPQLPAIEYHPRRDHNGDTARGDVRHAAVSLRDPVSLAVWTTNWLDANPEATLIMCAASNAHAGKIASALRANGIPFSNPWRTHAAVYNPLGATAHRAASLFTATPSQLWTRAEFSAILNLVKTSSLLTHGAGKAVQDAASDEPDARVTLDNLREWCKPDTLHWLCDFVDGGCPARDGFDWLTNHRNARHANANTHKLYRYLKKIIDRFGLDAALDPPRVHVGTFHSFKGAEADHALVFPDLHGPHLDAWTYRTPQLEQARLGLVRAFYVAFTRAIDVLWLAQPARPQRSAW